MNGIRLNDVEGSLTLSGSTCLIGLYACAVDRAGRIIVPTQFRQVLARRGFTEIGGYVDDGDGCIKLVPATLDVRTGVPRWFGVSLIQPDGMTSCCIFKLGKRGRITLPAGWREAAGITRNAYVQGMGAGMHVCSPEQYEARKHRVLASIAEPIAVQETFPCARSAVIVT